MIAHQASGIRMHGHTHWLCGDQLLHSLNRDIVLLLLVIVGDTLLAFSVLAAVLAAEV
jgi:hypothetical protein